MAGEKLQVWVSSSSFASCLGGGAAAVAPPWLPVRAVQERPAMPLGWVVPLHVKIKTTGQKIETWELSSFWVHSRVSSATSVCGKFHHQRAFLFLAVEAIEALCAVLLHWYSTSAECGFFDSQSSSAWKAADFLSKSPVVLAGNRTKPI